MPLKVIGVGFGRTGTHSLKLALEKLGYSKCYHMEELIMHHPHKISYWEDARLDKEINWEELFEGYQAAVDFPANAHYKKYLEIYPDAKFILTVRDPESWYNSFNNTIIKQSKPSLSQILSMSLKMMYDKKTRERLKVFKFNGQYLKTWFPNGFEDKAGAIDHFNNWNEEVRKTIPKDQLLEFDSRDGWKPLCDFLGKPVPDEPYPRSNTTADFNSRKV